MVLGTQDNPPSRDNFTEHLYENCMTKTKLTLLDYANILRLKKKMSIIIFPYFIVVCLLLSIVVFSHSENGPIILTEQ